MTNITRVKEFFHSKTGKVLPIILIALLIGAASSTVYVYYTASGTATVKAPDMVLRAGTDSGSCTTSWPCASVTVATSNDFETIAISMFPSVANTPQPATYYSNLTTIQNHGAVSHSIKSILVKVASGTANLGSLTLYYCTTQTEFNPDGTLVTPANCIGSYTMTSASGAGWNAVSGSFGSLASNAKGYFEMYGYALNTASVGATVTFQLGISWL